MNVMETKRTEVLKQNEVVNQQSLLGQRWKSNHQAPVCHQYGGQKSYTTQLRKQEGENAT